MGVHVPALLVGSISTAAHVNPLRVEPIYPNDITMLDNTLEVSPGSGSIEKEEEGAGGMHE